MSRKTPAGSGNGFNDIIGVALLAVALLLLVAQVSFDRYDLAFIHTPPNKPIHNWIGPFGAHVAYASFFLFGLGAFVLPFLLAAFGVGYLFNFLGYLRERRIWSVVWGVVMVLSLTGLLRIMNAPLRHLCVNINAPSAGGWFGSFTYDYGFWMLGSVGATIVYATLYLISLLFLTDFRLGDWLRRWFEKPETAEGATAEETALDRRARELEKQAKKLQEEVARSGLGADLQPVPEPTVRDLSVPPAKSARGKKVSQTEAPRESAPATESETAAPRDVAPATTDDILGKKSETEKAAETKIEEPEKAGPEKLGEPVVHVADGSVPAKPKTRPKRPKPITVAATPIIGNYQLQPLDFLQ